jgi:hypothetical protein
MGPLVEKGKTLSKLRRLRRTFSIRHHICVPLTPRSGAETAWLRRVGDLRCDRACSRAGVTKDPTRHDRSFPFCSIGGTAGMEMRKPALWHVLMRTKWINLRRRYPGQALRRLTIWCAQSEQQPLRRWLPSGRAVRLVPRISWYKFIKASQGSSAAPLPPRSLSANRNCARRPSGC